MSGARLDEDAMVAMVAAVDLVGRTGAREFEFGYLDDDVPVEKARWYAHAKYKGARISEENHRGPVEAAEALARRLLTGAKCAHCGSLVALSDAGAFAYADAHLVDGTPWTAEQAAVAGQCRWTRVGQTWLRGCESKRAARRRAARRGRKR